MMEYVKTVVITDA